MVEDYVSFGVAKLLKEKGFDWEVHRSYLVNDNCFVPADVNNLPDRKDAIRIPTLQMAMKWLREAHHIIIVPQPLSFNTAKDCLCDNWVYSLWVDYKLIVDESLRNQPGDYCPTYEKVCEAAILYCLKNLI